MRIDTPRFISGAVLDCIMARNDCPCLCHNNTHADFNFSCGQCYAANHMFHLNKKKQDKPKPAPRVRKAKAATAPATEPKKA